MVARRQILKTSYPKSNGQWLPWSVKAICEVGLRRFSDINNETFFDGWGDVCLRADVGIDADWSNPRYRRNADADLTGLDMMLKPMEEHGAPQSLHVRKPTGLPSSMTTTSQSHADTLSQRLSTADCRQNSQIWAPYVKADGWRSWRLISYRR